MALKINSGKPLHLACGRHDPRRSCQSARDKSNQPLFTEPLRLEEGCVMPSANPWIGLDLDGKALMGSKPRPILGYFLGKRKGRPRAAPFNRSNHLVAGAGFEPATFGL